MVGLISGAIIGSRFKDGEVPARDFELFTDSCTFTGGTVLTLAQCQAFLKSGRRVGDIIDNTCRSLRKFGRLYPLCDYDAGFSRWLTSGRIHPDYRCSADVAARAAVCSYVGRSVQEVRKLSWFITVLYQCHPEAIKGSQAVASTVFLSRSGASRFHIQKNIERYYDLDALPAAVAVNGITCESVVPLALKAFADSSSFEEAIRNAVLSGADPASAAALTGAVAGAFYGVPPYIRRATFACLDGKLAGILNEFINHYPYLRK